MGQLFKKGLVWGVLVGVLIGVAIGINVPSLDAVTPIDENQTGAGTANPDKTFNELSFAEAVGKQIVLDKSVQGVLSEQSITDGSGACPPGPKNIEVDTEAITDVIFNSLGIQGSRDCYVLEMAITVSPKIYWMNLSSAILVVSIKGSIKLTRFDEECIAHAEVNAQIDMRVAFKINNDFTLGDITNLPVGRPICTVSLPSIAINKIVGNKDLCPWCIELGNNIGI